MTDDIEQLDNIQFFVDRIEQEIILTQVQFPNTFLVSLQGMILPTCAQYEERSYIVYREKIDDFRCECENARMRECVCFLISGIFSALSGTSSRGQCDSSSAKHISKEFSRRSIALRFSFAKDAAQLC